MTTRHKGPLPLDGIRTLRAAYGRWWQETGFGNAYDWYRRNAQKGPKVFNLSSYEHGSARKVGRAWMIDVSELESAVVAHRAARAQITQVTADYRRRVLHGKSGDTVATRWGWYTLYDGFHSTTLSSPDPAWNRTESWYCSACWKPAATEHDKPECHTCQDWGSCGQDCTLSRVFCRKRETSLDR